MTKPAPRDQLIDKAVIVLTEEDLDHVVGGAQYLTIPLQEVFISSYSTSGHEGGGLSIEP